MEGVGAGRSRTKGAAAGAIAVKGKKQEKTFLDPTVRSVRAGKRLTVTRGRAYAGRLSLAEATRCVPPGSPGKP